jgi:hypothetical protein
MGAFSKGPYGNNTLPSRKTSKARYGLAGVLITAVFICWFYVRRAPEVRPLPYQWCPNRFLNSYSQTTLLAAEDKTHAYLDQLYGRTMAEYDELVACTDEGKPHPTACPVQEPAGPHAQYKLLYPIMACHNQVYFGSKAGDGRKAVCAPDQLVEGCVVYSLGSNNDFSFEDDILARTPCTVHTFDCTIGKKSGTVRDRLHFHDLCISGSRTNDTRYATVADIMAQLGHQRVDLMKMDIEGFEQPVFAGWRSDDALPDQMVVEIHGCNPPVRGRYRHLALAEMQLLFAKIVHLGYRFTVVDRQPGCSNCVEVTLIRTVCR